jgi:hypothetical protein
MEGKPAGRRISLRPPETKIQYSIFDDTLRIEKVKRVYKVVDNLSEKFGKHPLMHGILANEALEKPGAFFFSSSI